MSNRSNQTAHRVLSAVSRLFAHKTFENEGEPYLTRFRIAETRWGKLYLHHFHRNERYPVFHDHPYKGVGMILCGGYIEETLTRFLDVVSTIRKPGSVMWLDRTTRHRIATMLPGETWTLFATGPHDPEGRWGFYDERGVYTPWLLYLGRQEAAAWARNNKIGE